MSAGTPPPRPPARADAVIRPRAVDRARGPAGELPAPPRIGHRVSRSPFELLRCDHQRLAALLYRVESAANGRGRAQAFAELTRELAIHDDVEERIFYPALRQEEETRDITLDNYEQHRSIRRLVAEIAALDVADTRWPARLSLLSYRLQRHMTDEEQRLFAHARITLSRTRLAKLAERMEAARHRQAS